VAALAIRARCGIANDEAGRRVRRTAARALRSATTTASASASTLGVRHASPGEQSNDEPNARWRHQQSTPHDLWILSVENEIRVLYGIRRRTYPVKRTVITPK
jgi:hypothetical protein